MTTLSVIDAERRGVLTQVEQGVVDVVRERCRWFGLPESQWSRPEQSALALLRNGNSPSFATEQGCALVARLAGTPMRNTRSTFVPQPAA